MAANLPATRTRETFVSPVEGMTLTVIGASWASGADLDAVIAGTLAPEVIHATADGRSWMNGWHSGPEAEAVFVESYSAEGRTFHGWIDSVSRQLVQAG